MAVALPNLVRPADRPPSALRGHAHVHRYFDLQTQAWTAQIIAGELYVSPHDELISTVLGSCVAVCIRDPVAGVGGMNHFLLAGEDEDRAELRFGRFAIEQLISELVKHGGHRERFETRLFGGGRVLGGTIDIGSANLAFARRFLQQERLPIMSENAGGTFSRRVRYHPRSGEARVVLHDMARDR